jgi:hypothetical protein
MGNADSNPMPAWEQLKSGGKSTTRKELTVNVIDPDPATIYAFRHSMLEDRDLRIRQFASLIDSHRFTTGEYEHRPDGYEQRAG